MASMLEPSKSGEATKVGVRQERPGDFVKNDTGIRGRAESLSVLAQGVLDSLLDIQTLPQINQEFGQLSERLGAISQIDRETGAVRVDDSQLREAVTSTLPREAAGRMLAILRKQVAAGMAISKEGVAVPWSVISDPEGVRLLGGDGLRALGLNGTIPDNELLVELSASYRNVPVDNFQDDSVMAAMREQLQVADARDRAVEMRGRQPNGGGGLPPEDPPPLPTPTITPEIQKMLEDVVLCFGSARWYSYPPWYWSIDFERPCADFLEISLKAALVPLVAAAIGKAVLAGGTILAMVGATAAALGGFVVAGLIAVALKIAFLIGWNKTERGVALQSFWLVPFIWAKGL